MVIKKTKTNWMFIFIMVVLAGLVGGVILPLQANSLYKYFSSETEAYMKSIVQMPTGLDSNFSKQVDECFIPTAAVYGYTLRITSGFRSMTEQAQLYEQGRTVDGHIVSWASVGRSVHNYGFAVDVVDRWRGYDIDWKRVAKIALFCGLEQVDDPHFENRGGLTTRQFEAGARPLPLTLPCEIMDKKAKVNQPLTLSDLKSCGAPRF
jgi:hypothetical protein